MKCIAVCQVEQATLVAAMAVSERHLVVGLDEGTLLWLDRHDGYRLCAAFRCGARPVQLGLRDDYLWAALSPFPRTATADPLEESRAALAQNMLAARKLGASLERFRLTKSKIAGLERHEGLGAFWLEGDRVFATRADRLGVVRLAGGARLECAPPDASDQPPWRAKLVKVGEHLYAFQRTAGIDVYEAREGLVHLAVIPSVLDLNFQLERAFSIGDRLLCTQERGNAADGSRRDSGADRHATGLRQGLCHFLQSQSILPAAMPAKSSPSTS